MALGARLKKLRMGKKESLQQVADAVGASKAHIWELEKGTSKNPSIELLMNLAVHFKESLAALVGEDPNAKGEEPQLVAMYRELKGLDERDLSIIRGLMETLKSGKTESDED